MEKLYATQGTNNHTIIQYRWKEHYKDEYVANINSPHVIAQLEDLYDILDTEHPTTQLAYDYVEELTKVFTKSSKMCETQQTHKHQYKSANK